MKYVTPLCALVIAVPLAQAGTLDPVQHRAYDANAGWLDGSATSASSATVGSHYLSGQAYSANYGWINLGSGAPANGYAYSNSGAEFGVNLDPEAGRLSGFAYAANIGWVNFGWAAAANPQRPQVDLLTGQLAGFAWSANTGWINLAAMKTLSLAEIDLDGDGIDDAWERLHFGSLKTANASTDKDGDGISDKDEAIALTDPNDPASGLRILSHTIASAGAFQNWTVTFTSHPARRYGIQISPDLGLGNWSESSLGIFSPDGGSQTTRLAASPNSPQYFLRVKAVKPLQP